MGVLLVGVRVCDSLRLWAVDVSAVLALDVSVAFRGLADLGALRAMLIVAAMAVVATMHEEMAEEHQADQTKREHRADRDVEYENSRQPSCQGSHDDPSRGGYAGRRC